MSVRDRAEGRLWLLAALYLVAIYLSLDPLQFAMDFLRARNVLRLAISTTFAAAFLGVVWLGWRGRWNARQWLVAAAAALVVGALALRLEVVQERLHLVEYGLLGLLFWAALAWRDSRFSDNTDG